MHRHLKLALKVAELSECKFRLGAVVVKGGRVLGLGCNRKTNDPEFVFPLKCSQHAEAVALRRAGYPRGAKLYVARISRLNLPTLAKPCFQCEALIESLNCRVEWTT